jgi:hypothetical protein
VLPVPEPDHPVASTTAEGNITIRNAELKTAYLSQPLKIVSAQAILSPGQITWTNASFSYGKLEGQGSLELPVLCPEEKPCVRRFSLRTANLDAGALQSALLGSEGGELLRQFLDRIGSDSVVWPDFSGTVQAAELSAGKLVIHDASAAVDIGGRSIKLRSLNGRVANGVIHLAGLMNASSSPPKYQLEVELTNASPGALASLFEERWGTGAINLSAQLKMSGFSASDLSDSAGGTVHWNWTKGGLPAAQPFAQFDQWSADATIADSTMQITHSLLVRGQDAIPLAGTISFDREIDLKGGSVTDSVAVTGTMEHPEVKTEGEEASE